MFKSVRLTKICSGPKWTISASGGLGLLQVISKSDTRGGMSVRTLTTKIGGL